jgi:hypothetical protein
VYKEFKELEHRYREKHGEDTENKKPRNTKIKQIQHSIEGGKGMGVANDGA